MSAVGRWTAARKALAKYDLPYKPAYGSQFLGIMGLATVILAAGPRDMTIAMLALPALVLGVLEAYAGLTLRPQGLFEPLADVLAAIAAILLVDSAALLALMPLAVGNQIRRQGAALKFGIPLAALTTILIGLLKPAFPREAVVVALAAIVLVTFLPHQVEQRVRTTLQFFSNFGHEFRTPLTNIIAACHHMERHGVLSPSLQADVASVRESCGRMISNVDNALDLSKILAGRFEPKIGPVSVARLIAKLARTFGPKAGDRPFNVLFTGERMMFETSEYAVGAIAENLVSNAIKYADGSGIDIIVRVDAPQSGGGTLELLVNDGGIGIGPELQARMFDPFVTGSTMRSESQKSTGIGLSLVQGLATALGGKVAYKQLVPRGSRFIVRLPVVVASESGSQPLESDTSAKVVALLRTKDIGARLEAALGMSVEAADTMEQVLLAAKTKLMQGPVVLVVESSAAGGSLEALAKQIRQRLPGLILVAVTDVVGDQHRVLQLLAQAGYTAVLPRDAGPTQIRDSVDAALELADAHRAKAPKQISTSHGKDASTDPILVVEDEQAMRAYCSRILVDAGYTVESLKRGDEAIAAVSDPQRSYSVALLDFNLPGANADAIVRRLRERGSTMPVIIMSAAANIDTEISGKFAPGSVQAIMAKPPNEEEMLQLIYEHAIPDPNKRATTGAPRAADQAPAEGGILDALDGEGRLRMSTLFCRAVPQHLAMLRQHLVAGQLMEFYGAAHKFKSALAVMQEFDVIDLISRMETERPASRDLPGWLESMEELCIRAVDRHTRASRADQPITGVNA